MRQGLLRKTVGPERWAGHGDSRFRRPDPTESIQGRKFSLCSLGNDCGVDVTNPNSGLPLLFWNSAPNSSSPASRGSPECSARIWAFIAESKASQEVCA